MNSEGKVFGYRISRVTIQEILTGKSVAFDVDCIIQNNNNIR